jgi:hypothetical protein
MFADYRKMVSLLQFDAVTLKSAPVSKFDSKDQGIHVNDNVPVDEECYDGTVVDGTIVWKACSA